MIFGIAVLIVSALIIATIVIAIKVRRNLRSEAKRWGYSSVGAYLRAVPQSDEEKRSAVDMALKGLVICIVGLVFPPLILIGCFPLFYGTRKLAYSSMGLGLVDDGNTSRT